MADPCLGCGTEVDAATQQLKIKGANSRVWSTDYGPTATSSGLYCDPNTGNLWTPPPYRGGTAAAPAPTSWPGVTTSSGALLTYEYKFPVGTTDIAAVATSGTVTVTNDSSEPVIAKVRAGGYLGVYSGTASANVRVAYRVYVRYYPVIGGSYSTTERDIVMRSYLGLAGQASWHERDIGTWTVQEGAAIAVYYQPIRSATGVTYASPSLQGCTAYWAEPFANITYWTARSV